MPNICHTTIEISGTNDAVNEFKSVVKGGENTEFMQAILPLPEDANDEWVKKIWFGNREGRVLGEWKRVDDTTFALEIDTAWIPPYEPLIEVSKRYPDLTIKMICQSMESLFCGYAIINNGRDIESIYWSYGSSKNEEEKEYARKIFGTELVDEGRFYEEMED